MNYKPFWCYPAKDASLSYKTKAHPLHTMFECYILTNSDVWRMFDDPPIPYGDDIITQNPVDKKYQFSLDNVIAVVIIGQNSDLPLPSTKDEIIAILKSHHEV